MKNRVYSVGSFYWPSGVFILSLGCPNEEISSHQHGFR